MNKEILLIKDTGIDKRKFQYHGNSVFLEFVDIKNIYI